MFFNKLNESKPTIKLTTTRTMLVRPLFSSVLEPSAISGRRWKRGPPIRTYICKVIIGKVGCEMLTDN